MSAKSSAHHAVHTHAIFNRRFAIIGAFLIAIMFFVTILYYPLIFGPEKLKTDAPVTQVK